MPENNYMGTRYPKEVYSVVRKQTFYVNSELSPAKAKDGNNPLTVYSPFSRYVFNIINQDKVGVSANIKVDDIGEIADISRYLKQMEMDNKYKPKPVQTAKPAEKSLAETVRLTVGEYAGKTPYEVKAANGGNAKVLNATYSLLKKGLAANPDYQKQIDAIMALANGGEDLSGCEDATTLRFISGTFKGKTAAEVLLNEADGAAKMKRQREWLESNLKQYPNNTKFIHAIDSAFKLQAAGKLNADAAETAQTTGTGAVIPVYQSGYRPLIRKKKMFNGVEKCHVYEIDINWTMGIEYPVQVVIRTYYAPVIKKDDGMINVVAREAEDKKINTMSLTAKEWMNCLAAIETNMRQFEVINAKGCYADAEDALRRNMSNAG